MYPSTGDYYKKKSIEKIKKGKIIRKEKKIVIKSDSILPVIEANIRLEIEKFRRLIRCKKIDASDRQSLSIGICCLQKKLVFSIYTALLEVELNERGLAA
jgi:hypothetical protein